METQNISLAQLGVNSKLADQVYFRRRSTCAPIREELFYLRTYTAEDLYWLKQGENITIYQFSTGSSLSSNGSLLHPVGNDNLGSSYDIAAYYMPILNTTNTTTQDSPPRLVDPLASGFHGPSVVLLSGRGIIFYEESDDPLWSVHTEVKYANGSIAGFDLNKAPRAYRMDSNLNIIGCDERIQICSAKRCFPWSGLLPGFTIRHLDERATDEVETSVEINVLLDMLRYLIPGTSIPDSIANRDGSSALRASRNMQSGIQLHLEPEQWKTELTYWFGLAMARLQLDMYKTIERPDGLDGDSIINAWSDPSAGLIQDMLCGKIKFRSPNHTSLSFVGIMMVVVVSLVLIVLSFFDVFITLLPTRWRGNRVLLWASSENLVLLEGSQRLENEALTRDETKA
ncbi:hypothetical protein ACHAPT_009947 [Fusarium lateritium]